MTYLSSFPCFRAKETRSRKPPNRSLSPPIKGLPLNFIVTFTVLKGEIFSYFQWKLRDPIVTDILSQYARVTVSQTDNNDDWQTTYYDNSRTLQCNCNVWLKIQQVRSKPANQFHNRSVWYFTERHAAVNGVWRRLFWFPNDVRIQSLQRYDQQLHRRYCSELSSLRHCFITTVLLI